MLPTRLIDAHVHFWDPNTLHYPWIVGTPALRRPFLPDDLQALRSASLAGVVVVEANCLSSQNIAEMDFVDALAEQEPRIAGAVAFVDLGDASGWRRALALLARRERVVGVRHNIQGHPAGFSLQPEFVRGAQEAGANDLRFDLCVTADQLLEATDLVRRCPETTFVLDHCGKPFIRSGMFEPWATDLTRLAECTNVVCKLSGLLSEARPDQRDEDVLFKYARHAMSCFGTARLLYGSDWPVVITAGGEGAWLTLVDRFTSDWTADARDAFYFGNAMRYYGLRQNAHS